MEQNTEEGSAPSHKKPARRKAYIEKLMEEYNGIKKKKNPPRDLVMYYLLQRKDAKWVNLESRFRYEILYGEPGDFKLTQAERVLFRFGGPYRFAMFVEKVTGVKTNHRSYYHWLRTGLIPSHKWELIFKVAKYTCTVLDTTDFDPRPLNYDFAKNTAVRQLEINDNDQVVL